MEISFIRKFVQIVYAIKDLIIYSNYAYKTNCFFVRNNILNQKTDKKILIYLEPWGGTTVPFFQLVVGLLLKPNNRIHILFNDLPFGKESNFIQKTRIYILLKILKKVGFPYERLSKVSGDVVSYEKKWLDFAINVNLIHDCKGEFIIDGELESVVEVQLKNMLLRLLKYDFKKFDLIYFPGGLWKDTSFLKRICEENKIQYSTFDAGEGILFSANNGVASQMGDIVKAFELLKEKYWDNDIWYRIAKDEFKKRQEANDKFNYQVVGKSKNIYIDKVGYLLMMNSIWDSAALGIHNVFTSYKEWVLNTIDWVLKNTKDTITIREHPADRFPDVRSNDDYKSLINQLYKDNKRVIFIGATDFVNSYNLIEKSKCVLVFSSTVAKEATFMNKAVICVSNCYYSNLGFVLKPENKKDYFNFLKNIDEYRITDEKKKIAYAIYFLVQTCFIVDTIFIPSNCDFEKYIHLSVEELLEKKSVKAYIQSVNESVPLSFLIAKQMLEQGYING